MDVRKLSAFELWCWRRLLGLSWTARDPTSQSLKEMTGRTDAEAPILWPPDAKNWLTGMLGKIEGRRRRG